ncbi:efflux RND transporter periplasmic adaptor subunit [Novipirellula rosea]|uniref:Efflux RND transporter periplasmic adaptor subunit n=2 Tax=Novipirellula rosea TaxID=1031540 RepID=A0ABP8NT73_9BACT
MNIAAFRTVILGVSFLVLLPACNKLSDLKNQYYLSHSEAYSSEGLVPHAEHHDAEPSSHGEESHQADHHEGHQTEHHGEHKIVVTSPVAKDVVSTQQYVCQIHSWRHIEVCALEGGYLETIAVQEGQRVKQGELLFKILPTLYEARLESDMAEAQLARIELQNTERLFEQNIVAQPEVALAKAKLAKAQAKVNLAQAELNFATIRAPFDGIVDKQHEQQGSLIEEGDVLTTLSDNSTMWAYFNVPEARYLQYEATPDKDNVKVELVLADGNKFPHAGAIGAIEADFNNETGNIAFRGDFPNPQHLLRHGQTGTVLLSRVVPNAIVIPQRATFEILAKRYTFVVDDEGVAHQREIVVQSEQDDIYLIKQGLDVNEKIVLEGIRQVRDGEHVQYEFQAAEDVLDNLKYHAE